MVVHDLLEGLVGRMTLSRLTEEVIQVSLLPGEDTERECETVWIKFHVSSFDQPMVFSQSF